MNISQLVDTLEKKAPLESDEKIIEFEAQINARLPDEYRQFLQQCNGGQVGKDILDSLWFDGSVGIRWFGGFREESSLSLEHHRELYQSSTPARIPRDLIWIGGDVFGNVICLGIHGEHRGKVFFWDHECEPNPKDWDGSVEMSDNIFDVADSFQEFIDGLKTDAEMEEPDPVDACEWKGMSSLPDGRKFIADASFLMIFNILR